MALRPPPPTGPAGPVALRPLVELEPRDWARFHAYFRDREIAEWNGSSPLRMPLWLFKRVVLGEEKGGERYGFGIYADGTRFIGSVELYDVAPAPPRRPLEATLGIVIGEKSLWGRGYGPAACRAVLDFAFGKLHLERVRLTTVEHNHRARRAFEKVGFRFERLETGERGVPFARYAIERSEWPVL